MIKEAVILAGGKGTRLGSLTKKIPKPMIKIGGLPILEHQIKLLERYGVKRITVLTGYLSDVIESHIVSRKYKTRINILKSDLELGTADRVKLVENKIKEDFLVLYGDIMLDIDFKKLENFHKKKKSLLTLVVHPSDYMHDCDLIETDDNGRICAFHPKPHDDNAFYRNLDNSCVYLMNSAVLKHIDSKPGKELDFGRDVFPKLFRKVAMYGYNSPEYIKDMGTPERLKQVNEDFLSKKIARLNRKNKRKAIFLDRDGVVSFDSHHLADVTDMRLLPYSAEAIKMINSSEYLAILVTNQSVIARGDITIGELRKVHDKLETLLGKKGAKLDSIYFCPHYPKKGIGGVKKLLVACKCRKPKPGMLLSAAKDYNIDLEHSWIIGDSESDIQAGKKADTKTILVKKNQEAFKECDLKTKKADDLLSAVKMILN